MDKAHTGYPQAGDGRQKREAIRVRLTDELQTAMIALAAKHDRSLSAEVRVAIRQYLERQPAEEDSGDRPRTESRDDG